MPTRFVIAAAVVGLCATLAFLSLRDASYEECVLSEMKKQPDVKMLSFATAVCRKKFPLL
ncbi:hypothetical protein [Enterovibrio sp. 27052020O]|uniref:hypothetical protein n=1 Tax=Enterovibrio sp. 27052020O TaxID=3241166 RepID=UPI00388DD98D